MTDRATGLVWQRGGSPNYMLFKDAAGYIERLNRDRLGGYTDWRLPTLEEAASLLESEQRNGGLYIDPKFDKTQLWIWTSDNRKGSGAVRGVSFPAGRVRWYDPVSVDWVRGCRAAGQ